jgi:hypothetical protein
VDHEVAGLRRGSRRRRGWRGLGEGGWGGGEREARENGG